MTQIIREIPFSFPSFRDQRRIAAILDQADVLRAKRRAALALLDEMTQAIFVDMFGSPSSNPKGWRLASLGSLSNKFSDGPFGSNLKSSHYVEQGVRVVRLQNIGVGIFLDDNRAFISKEHFSKLSRHECKPGDVLIGTLGEPNLRACIQPQWLKIALNKADCVQMRVNPKVAVAEYVVALLSNPETEQMAQDKILGQTRLRISMGRLRELQVPVPPISLQSSFAKKILALDVMRRKALLSLENLESLFASLQHRAFRGEL